MAVSMPDDAKRKIAGAILLSGAVCLGILALSLCAPEPIPSTWKGYRVLLVDRTIPEADVLASLKREGITRVVSESTEAVLVSDWSKLESMSLAEARARISPGDPRLDSYIQRLGLWFTAHAGKVECRAYFIEDRSSGSKLSKAVLQYKNQAFLPDEGIPSSSCDRASLSFALAVLIMIASAIASPFIGKTASSLRAGLFRRRLGFNLDKVSFRLFIALPWAVLACGGRVNAAIASLWAIASIELADILDVPLEEFRQGRGIGALKSLRIQSMHQVSMLLCAVLALGLTLNSIGSIAVACIGSLAAAAGYACISLRSSSRKRYVPIPIGRYPRRREARAARKAQGLLACVVILAWGFGDFLAPAPKIRANAEFEYPIPIAQDGNTKPTVEEAKRRRNAESGAILPGLASFLEHKAIQEALPFVRIGEGRPDPFAESDLPMPGGEMQALSFDDNWARKSYASLPSVGIESMLLAQGHATVGRAGGSFADVDKAGRGRPLAPIRCLLYIFLLVPSLARLLGGLSPEGESPSGKLRQEA
jgi:hypothetical protein